MKLRQLLGVAGCSALLLIGGSIAYADQGNGQGQNQNDQGQNQNNQGDDPFHGKTDSGDDASILPTPDVLLGKGGAKPNFANKSVGFSPEVFPASYGSGNLINHGGPEIPAASYFAVYWNGAVANSTATSTHITIQQLITNFVGAFGSGGDYSQAATDDFSIIQQYGASQPISAKLPYIGSLVDTRSSQSSISDSSIRSWLTGLFNAGRVTPSAATLYGLYFPPGMRITLNFFQSSCTYFCGYHSSFSYNGKVIKYAVFPYLNCAGCSISPLTVGDMLTIVSSHEIREAVSDPQGSAWYDSKGNEADDKCVWHNLYQMKSGGAWVQPEYSNGLTVTLPGHVTPTTFAGPGCVVPF